eukprot:6351767-Pyramimonas_sp.AAC.1
MPVESRKSLARSGGTFVWCPPVPAPRDGWRFGAFGRCSLVTASCPPRALARASGCAWRLHHTGCIT